MKKLNERQKRYFYLGLTLFISLSLVVIVSTFFTQARFVVNLVINTFSALSSVWIGLIIAYLINPIARFFEEKVFMKLFKGKKGLARGISVAVSILLLLAMIAGLLILVIPQLIDTIGTLAKNLPGYYSNLRGWIYGIVDPSSAIGGKILEFVDNGYDMLINWVQNELLPNVDILGAATSALLSAVGILVDFFIGIIIAIYLLCDKEHFILQARKLTASVFSEKWYTRIRNICSETHHVFGEFLLGKILDSLLVGIVTFLFMWLTKMPYATLVSVLLAVCNLIPFFGQFIGIIPSFLLILVIDPVKAIIWLVVIIVYMQIDANVITPKILGNSIGLGSFWILFSIVLFGGLFGVIGMLVGVPVFAVIYRLIKRSMDHRLNRKGLPTEAYAYAGNSPTYPDRKGRRKLEGPIKSTETVNESSETPESNEAESADKEADNQEDAAEK